MVFLDITLLLGIMILASFTNCYKNETYLSNMSIMIKITLLTTNRGHLPKYGLVKKNIHIIVFYFQIFIKLYSN